MTGRLTIFAAWALLSLPIGAWAAEGQKPEPGSQGPERQAFGDIQARAAGEPVLLDQGYVSQWDLRFGWWAFWHSGSPSKVGEYQGLDSSPFWDVDGFRSDGTRTLGFTATGMDDETTRANLYFYRPGLTAVVDYDRFLHRLDHDPYNNFANVNPALPNNPGGFDPLTMKQDLNAGQDYVLRVQELNGSFKGIVDTDNLKVRLDLWGMRKEGNRQNSANAMCYNRNVTGANLPPDHLGPDGAPLGTFVGGRCHVLSQSQHIDWLTMEIKPVVEARFGDRLSVEYSRPMRGFTADDQVAARFYDVTGALVYNPVTNPDPYATGVVPDNYTEMDQLKIRGQITDYTSAYAYLMVGRTVDREIDMNRRFNNADVRVTNTAIDNTTITGYAKFFNENEEMADLNRVTALERYNNPREPGFIPELDEPIDYHRRTAGLKGVWRPYGGGFTDTGLALTGGYEYGVLERTNAIFTSDDEAVTLDQTYTVTNSFQVAPYYRWSACFDTFVRYKYQNAEQPLIGFKSINGTFNTLLPEQTNIVETGFDWFPTESFMLNAVVGLEYDTNHSAPATGADPAFSRIDYSEQSYPFAFNAWYAVTKRFSVSGGYSVFSNFVAQDITLGSDLPGSQVSPVRAPWRYSGKAEVVTVGSRYCLTEDVSLTGLAEWVRGHNLITDSTTVFPSGIVVTDLGSYSQVLNETTRVSVGADWQLRPRVVTYVRYELYNFHDVAPGYQTGLAQGILGGFSALF